MGMVFTWIVLILGAILAVFGARALVVRRGPWRWMALVLLLLVLGVVLRIVVDVRADPTSHNLWPLEVLAAVIAASALLGILEIIRMGAVWLGRGGHHGNT